MASNKTFDKTSKNCTIRQNHPPTQRCHSTQKHPPTQNHHSTLLSELTGSIRSKAGLVDN